MVKYCNRCKEELVFGENWTESQKNQYRYVCSKCKYVQDRKKPNYRLKHYYGITLEDKENLFNEQDGKCLLCEIVFDAVMGKDVCVDHCHTTGRVRGLLCRQCNCGLGNFKDDVSVLKKAIAYLA